MRMPLPPAGAEATFLADNRDLADQPNEDPSWPSTTPNSSATPWSATGPTTRGSGPLVDRAQQGIIFHGDRRADCSRYPSPSSALSSYTSSSSKRGLSDASIPA
jgi:hypothetical protein